MVSFITPLVDHGGLSLDVIPDGDRTPIREKPPTEYVAAESLPATLGLVSRDVYSPFVRPQPLHVLRAIGSSPAAASSIATLKAAVLSGGFQFTPAGGPAGADEESDEDSAAAERAADECRRAAETMPVSFDAWAWEAMDAISERHKLAEIVMAPVTEGPDKGLYAITALKHKPRWSYRYRVDRALNVVAIDCWTVDREWERLDPDGFVSLAWEPRDGDPRGSTVLDRCFLPWNQWVELLPEFQQGNKQFGTPCLFGTTSPHTMKMVPVLDREGNPTGKTITAERQFAANAERARNGSTIVAPPDATLKVLESSRDNLTIINALEYYENLIVKTILLQLRATVEAKHGSRADSETGQDVLGTLVRHVRQWVCQGARRAFHAQLRANHGPEFARRFTPRISLGKTEHQDFAAIAGAIALLYQAGFFTEAQLLWLDDFLGLPLRKRGAVRVGPQKDNVGSTGATPPPGVAALDIEGLRAAMADLSSTIGRFAGRAA